MQLTNLEQRERMYHDLAWLFPIITPPEDYANEASEFTRAIHQFSLRPAHTLLNLGAGAGHNDLHLKKTFQVTGLDLSESMLALARNLNPEVEYLVGDMRSARLERKFDAVMIADAVGYMLTESDLLAAFHTAYVHLEPGGVFCTYAEETQEKFKQNGMYTTTHQAGDLEVALVENYYDADSQDTRYESTFLFLIRQQGKLTIEVDQHFCGLFPLATWQRLLEQAGFQVHELHFAEGDCPFFACVKLLQAPQAFL